MERWMRSALESVGIREVQAVERVDDYILRTVPVSDHKLFEREVKSKLARVLSAFILENATVESVRDMDRMATHYRMRTWIADDEAVSKLVNGRVYMPTVIDWDSAPLPSLEPPKKEYIEAHISSVPAGEIPEKPTAEMLSAFDDAYNAALFDPDDKVAPEERGIEAVLKLLRKV